MPVSTIGTNGLTSGLGVTALTLSVNGNNISAVNSLGFRNRIINGNMVIDQRNAGAAVTGQQYVVDRWRTWFDPGTYSFQQVTDAPTGFTNSLRVTKTNTTQSNYAFTVQYIEGLNCADLAWGTASAQTVTISFWVKSSITGAFTVSVGNSAENRWYGTTYTINAASTWEYKTVTIPGDTSGTWLTTNGIGIQVVFNFGQAATAQAANTWTTSANARAVTGSTSLGTTNNATWQITGVQLEAGSVATPFERRDYGRELIMCQRYYWRETNPGSGFVWSSGYLATGSLYRGYKAFPVAMRAGPTFGFSTASNAMAINSINGNQNINAYAGVVGIFGANIEFTLSTSVTSGGSAVVYAVTSGAAYMDFSAEL
jgi:hypothetical protein